MRIHPWLALTLLAVLAAAPAQGRSADLTEAQQRKLDENFKLVLKKDKGPYSANYCVCRNGERKAVFVNGRIVSPCGGNPRFCAAYREPWAEALADERMYIANLFARDLFLWDKFPDQHDLVRGYVLEKFFIETHPDHKLATMRAYGGLAGAEYEARDAPRFFERYLALDDFDEPRHYLLAYELQRRFFVRDDQGRIGKARNLASAIHRSRPDFKPLRDAVHNQISAGQIPRIQAYRDGLSAGAVRDQVDELLAEMKKLTTLDDSALRAQLAEIEDEGVRASLQKQMPAEGATPLASIQGLAGLMRFSRQTVEAKQVSPADRRRLVDIAITAAAVVQQGGAALLDTEGGLSVRQHLELLVALTDAAYGGGLLMERERAAASASLDALLSGKPRRSDLKRGLVEAARVVEWAQHTTLYAFEEAMPAWTYLIPDVGLLPDDVLRGSPLMVYARSLQQLEDHAAGPNPIRHELFGESLERDLRALNPGLALGTLRVAPETGGYSRFEVVALPETPADLEPAAGIVTRGEGNVVSHVQLLARALGIPNAVVGPSPYESFAPHDGEEIFFIATPGGRVVLKTVAQMTDDDREVLAEYTRNQERTDDGSLGGGGPKLHIDVERLDVDFAGVIDLASMRRKDSGVRCGPKAAFLGELKHHFPDKVARGIVVPFGAYHAHFRAAPVVVPPELADDGIAKPGEPLQDFVKRTYAAFFDELVSEGKDERELSSWIQPRLAVMRASIEAHPISAELREGIRAELERQGLLLADDPAQTVGLFVRSDTNVEDLENFNGAGLNLTLFNRRTLDDVYAGLKEVWASPFTYRSFSWRQTLIDEPLWVLPSVVILESVPTEKSGVLVTADLEGSDRKKMLVATSEGVGGAVDGTPAETLVWSREGVELVTMFKSPYRRLLKTDGGSEVLPSTGSEFVLSEAELDDLVGTAARIRDKFEPSRDSSGQPRPWDIEFGFAEGKLWLFQTRPFIGNESLKNVPALAAYEAPSSGAKDKISLDDKVR